MSKNLYAKKESNILQISNCSQLEILKIIALLKRDEYVVITPSQLTFTTHITIMGAMEVATGVFSHSMVVEITAEKTCSTIV